jgi:hypothetical protein
MQHVRHRHKSVSRRAVLCCAEEPRNGQRSIPFSSERLIAEFERMDHDHDGKLNAQARPAARPGRV